MNCEYTGFENDEPDLLFGFSPTTMSNEELANLIFRMSEYRQMHRHIAGALDSLSNELYKTKDFEEMMQFKKVIRVFLYARESLHHLDLAFDRDIQAGLNYMRDHDESK